MRIEPAPPQLNGKGRRRQGVVGEALELVQAELERLRRENERLRAEVKRLRALAREREAA